MPLLEGLTTLGIATKGTGADNIRNVTGSPTAGIDAQELLDTRPYARAWHHHILNDRVALRPAAQVQRRLRRRRRHSGAGGYQRHRLHGGDGWRGRGRGAGVWFRLGIGGITGHEDFATYGNVYVKPDEAVAVADAIVRVFIDHGDRTDRKKARLKYVLDAWGLENSWPRSRPSWGASWRAWPTTQVSAPNRQQRQAHVGVHAQKQAGQGVGRRGAAGRQA